MTIHGNQVILKAVEPEELKDRLVWFSDPDITHYFTNLGIIPMSVSDMASWYEQIHHRKTQEIHFSIFNADQKHIGGAQLKAIDWRNRSAEVGLFIGAKEDWGKGYGTETTGLLLRHGFLTLNLNRIWLRVDVGNLGAIKCYRKCGFTDEGLFRQEVYREGSYHDSCVMSILRSEYDRIYMS